MVERLKEAIAKARERREALGGEASEGVGQRPAASAGSAAAGPDEGWSQLPEFAVDDAHLLAQRVVTYRKGHPAHVTFDVLRTRLLRVCADKGWVRVGVTSPTKGCGKSLVCANLAFSIARHQDARALLVDLDLRAPRLAQLVGDPTRRRIGDFLAGRASIADAFVRVGSNLALGLNTERERDPAEIMQGARIGETLAATLATLKPDLALIDLPPLLAVDDAIGFLPNLDAVLLIAAAGQTRASDIAEAERMLADGPPLIGVVLNRQAEAVEQLYAYDYGQE